MGQRIVFKRDVLTEVVKAFETMYVSNNLYDYANYITLYASGGQLFFQMCIILDNASSDSMVRLFEDAEGIEDFSPLTINFTQFKAVIKAMKESHVIVEVSDKSVVIQDSKITHTLELSTVLIPNQIVKQLDDFIDSQLPMSQQLISTNREKAIDFNLLKLYNNMNMIGETLTVNTLYNHLYGIMHTPRFMSATTGFTISMISVGVLDETFLFPKHSLKILKFLPKIGAKYLIKDKKMFITGAGFHCYIGAWANDDKYPINQIEKLIDLQLNTVDFGQELIDAVKSCHQFSDTAYVYPGLGYATNKNATHKVTFTPTPDLGGGRVYLHKDVLSTIGPVETLQVDIERSMFKATNNERIYVFLGMRDEDEE